MTAPQTIDTDALRKLCEAAPDSMTIRFGENGIKGPPVMLQEAERFYTAARNTLPAILDELDRLRAAEAASKARVEELERKLLIRESVRAVGKLVANATVCGDQTVMVNEETVQSLYRKWRDEQKAYDEVRAELDTARAEIGRLTDAGAEDFGTFIPPDQITDENLIRPYAELKPASVPPPPAAADRGAPGQRLTIARLIYERLQNAELLHPELFDWQATTQDAPFYALADEIAEIAALATAPEAEDVRREAIEELLEKEWREWDRIRREQMEKGNPNLANEALAVRNYTRELKRLIRAIGDRPAS